MNDDRYQLAGWLAIASAVLIVPLTVLTVIVKKISGDHLLGSMFISAAHLVGSIVSVYIYYMFKKLLNDKYSFHRIDTLILIYIGCSVLYLILGLIGLMPGLEKIIAVVSVVLYIPFGVVTILLGVNILKLDDDLFGLMKPFAYLTIAAGICAVTVILIPLGLLAAIATLFILGMIFLRAREQVEFV